MEEAVRETLCTRCLHLNVCSRKDDYLKIVGALQETFNRFPEEDRAHMILKDPDCKFADEEINPPNFMTRTGSKLGENY